MTLHNSGPYILTIASGQTDSPAFSLLLSAGQMKLLLSHATKLGITTPASLTGTVTVEAVGADGGSTWTTFQINGTDVTLAADKTDLFPMGGIRDIRLHSSSAEGADRDFLMTFQVEL